MSSNEVIAVKTLKKNEEVLSTPVEEVSSDVEPKWFVLKNLCCCSNKSALTVIDQTEVVQEEKKVEKNQLKLMKYFLKRKPVVV